MTDETGDYGDRRGPRGRLHYPEFNRGCQYDRPATCCLVCYLRFLLGGR